MSYRRQTVAPCSLCRKMVVMVTSWIASDNLFLRPGPNQTQEMETAATSFPAGKQRGTRTAKTSPSSGRSSHANGFILYNIWVPVGNTTKCPYSANRQLLLFKTNPCRPYRLRDNRTISQRNDGIYILIHCRILLALKWRPHNRLAGIFYFHPSRLPIGARIFIRSSVGTVGRRREITTRENVLYEVIKAASRGGRNERSASILGSAGHRENERPERGRLSVAATALFRFSASFQPTKRTTDSRLKRERGKTCGLDLKKS